MEPSTGATTSAERLIMESSLQYENMEEELLPGIPNDITLSKITPKLSWRDSLNLSSVSCDWEKAIHGHLVHNERLRTQSATTLAVVAWLDDPMIRISLYSMGDKSFFDLPPIPGIPTGIPRHCQCVSLDSKLYILGGQPSLFWKEGFGMKTVYLLDLAGQRQWKQCASMGEPRENFGAGAVNGKICVFGGSSNEYHNPFRGAEVYDPENDSWRGIHPMVSEYRVNHRVVTIGEELFVHGGNSYTYRNDSNARLKIRNMGPALSVEVYHPGRDEWRLIEIFGRNHDSKIHFTVEGKIHAIYPGGIFVHDIDTHLWSLLQACSFPDAVRLRSTHLPLTALVLEGEIIVAVEWYEGRNYNDNIFFRTKFQKCLLQSKGFGHETQEVQWERIGGIRSTACLDFKLPYDLLCTIQL